MTVRMRGALSFVAAAGLALALAALDPLLDGEKFDLAEFGIDVIEKLVLFAAMFFIGWMAIAMREMQVEQESLRFDLARAVAEAEEWRRRSARHLDTLAEAIRDQFDAWHLTEAEAEIAWLMLKGFALKEIATLRHTSQATIRQQASGIYRKSGLSGRAELSAYFLDSLTSFGRPAEPR